MDGSKCSGAAAHIVLSCVAIYLNDSMAAPWEDRISNLSDEVTCHILSFIPTKNAVATSILSKRWTHLWRSVPLLDFTDIKLGDSESILRFNQFLYSVMLSREVAGNHSINSFYLDIAYAEPNNLTKWVNLAVQRKVKHLNLHLNLLNDPIDVTLKFPIPKLPNCTIFNCKTLVVLKLSWLSLDGFSFSSVGFGFPSLKTLHLKYINFHYDRDFLLLLDGCPILEDFKAFDIITFKDATERPQVFHSLSLNKLIRADVTEIICNNFPMKALFNSEFLRIQLMENYFPYDFPTFNNLTHLVINIDWHMCFMKVLHHCPKLQNLELYEKTQMDLYWPIEEEEGGKIWVEPKSAPQFLSLYLRTCTFRDFAYEGLQHDITLARYILNNARVLQTMTIWSDKEQPEIERELSSCPRASATCQLSVY